MASTPLDSRRSLGTGPSTRSGSLGTGSDPERQRDAALPDLQDRGRVIVERVYPEIDGGRFPIKRSVGERVTVSADVFADGHEKLAGVVKYRQVPAGRPSHGIQGSAEPAPRTESRPGPVERPAPGETDPAWQEVPLIARDKCQQKHGRNQRHPAFSRIHRLELHLDLPLCSLNFFTCDKITP